MHGAGPDVHSMHGSPISSVRSDPSIPGDLSAGRPRPVTGAAFTTRTVRCDPARQTDFQTFIGSFPRARRRRWAPTHKMPDVKGPSNWLDRPDLREPYISRKISHHTPRRFSARETPHRQSARLSCGSVPTLSKKATSQDQDYLCSQCEAGKGQSPIMQHWLCGLCVDMNLLRIVPAGRHGLTWFRVRS